MLDFDRRRSLKNGLIGVSVIHGEHTVYWTNLIVISVFNYVIYKL
jgi:hypothetical protein